MYSIFMINTYNESSLHKMIKNMVAKEVSGITEKEINGYICDIYGTNGKIYEVQTKNLGNLTGKILNLLESYPVTLIYPLPVKTYIEYYAEKNIEGKPLSRRKAPGTKTIYNIFDELMGCFPLLLKENFTLAVVETSITKERLRTAKKVQSANKNRRFLKDWLTHDTTLDEIYSFRTFCEAKDYIELLPKNLETFTINDLAQTKEFAKINKNQIYKMMWTFEKMGIVECIGKVGRSREFKILTNW